MSGGLEKISWSLSFNLVAFRQKLDSVREEGIDYHTEILSTMSTAFSMATMSVHRMPVGAGLLNMLSKVCLCLVHMTPSLVPYQVPFCRRSSGSSMWRLPLSVRSAEKP